MSLRGVERGLSTSAGDAAQSGGDTSMRKRNRPPYLCCAHLVSSYYHFVYFCWVWPSSPRAQRKPVPRVCSANPLRTFVTRLFGAFFPAGRAIIGSCLVPRLRKMTGSTISPHCTQRWAANSVSPMQNNKSIWKSVTMSPPHLVHVDSCRAAEESLWYPICSALVSFANALAMTASQVSR
jgi:hypothetical protein